MPSLVNVGSPLPGGGQLTALNTPTQPGGIVLTDNFTVIAAAFALTVTVGGDLSGTPTVPVVAAVQGKAFDTPTTKGDIFVYNGTAIKRLGAGSNGQVISADSTAATGIKWFSLGSAALLNADNTANNLPLLDSGGKLASSVLPPLAINDTFLVASQAAMLALTAQRGDIAIRSDTTPPNLPFILTADSPATLGSWTQLAPSLAILSINGLTGTSVTITTSSIAEGTNLYYTNARADARVVTGLTAFVANDIGGTITAPVVVGIQGKAVDVPTTKGDILVYDGTAYKRLAAGTNTHVLTADSSQATGLKYAAPSGGGTSYSATVGDGAASTFTLTHGFSTRALCVDVYDASDSYAKAYPRITLPSTTTVTLDFGSTVPTSNQFLIVVK